MQKDLSNGDPKNFKDRYTLQDITYSEVKYTSAQDLLEQLDREGIKRVTADSVPHFVLMTIADFEALRPNTPDKTPRLRRIEGILYREVGK